MCFVLCIIHRRCAHLPERCKAMCIRRKHAMHCCRYYFLGNISKANNPTIYSGDSHDFWTG